MLLFILLNCLWFMDRTRQLISGDGLVRYNSNYPIYDRCTGYCIWKVYILTCHWNGSTVFMIGWQSPAAQPYPVLHYTTAPPSWFGATKIPLVSCKLWNINYKSIRWQWISEMIYSCSQYKTHTKLFCCQTSNRIVTNKQKISSSGKISIKSTLFY